jgi:hypothetical protein
MKRELMEDGGSPGLWGIFDIIVIDLARSFQGKRLSESMHAELRLVLCYEHFLKYPFSYS